MKKDTLKSLLPLGSVVSLKKGTKKVLIVGRVQEHVSSGKLYDYSAVYYPEGMLDPHELFLFQQEDIDKLYHVGLQDNDEFIFRSFLEDKLKEKNLLE